MIWEDEQEIINELLYWQKRALEAEKKLKEFESNVDDAFSEYTKKLIKEERRSGMIEVDGNR